MRGAEVWKGSATPRHGNLPRPQRTHSPLRRQDVGLAAGGSGSSRGRSPLCVAGERAAERNVGPSSSRHIGRRQQRPESTRISRFKTLDPVGLTSSLPPSPGRVNWHPTRSFRRERAAGTSGGRDKYRYRATAAHGRRAWRASTPSAWQGGPGADMNNGAVLAALCPRRFKRFRREAASVCADVIHIPGPVGCWLKRHIKKQRRAPSHSTRQRAGQTSPVARAEPGTIRAIGRRPACSTTETGRGMETNVSMPLPVSVVSPRRGIRASLVHSRCWRA